jgi:hypothetical protein
MDENPEQGFINGVNDTGDNISRTPVPMTPAINTKLRISLRIFEKVRHGPNRILRSLGKLIRVKNLKSKISCQTPFNETEKLMIHLLITQYCNV